MKKKPPNIEAKTSDISNEDKVEFAKQIVFGYVEELIRNGTVKTEDKNVAQLSAEISPHLKDMIENDYPMEMVYDHTRGILNVARSLLRQTI